MGCGSNNSMQGTAFLAKAVSSAALVRNLNRSRGEPS
ncbi:unnamed protein product [Ectocarpus sp. CCAP 1310/34]|nr:unnamed protein product [Ectocarpus sp. CCAP 1310/34]